MGREASVRTCSGIKRLAGSVRRPPHPRIACMPDVSFAARWKLIDRLGDDLVEETLNEVAVDLSGACDHAVDTLCEQEFALA